MKRMLARVAALVALAAPGLAHAAGSPFQGPNCQLTEPPAGAGELLASGAQLRVHPRKGAIAARYKGCQATWVESKSRWEPLGVTYLEGGEVRGFYAPPPDTLTCRYQDRRAVGANAKQCPPAASLVVRSMASGCAEKMMNRHGAEGCKLD